MRVRDLLVFGSVLVAACGGAVEQPEGGPASTPPSSTPPPPANGEQTNGEDPSATPTAPAVVTGGGFVGVSPFDIACGNESLHVEGSLSIFSCRKDRVTVSIAIPDSSVLVSGTLVDLRVQPLVDVTLRSTDAQEPFVTQKATVARMKVDLTDGSWVLKFDVRWSSTKGGNTAALGAIARLPAR